MWDEDAQDGVGTAFQTQHIRWKWTTSFIPHYHRKNSPLPPLPIGYKAGWAPELMLTLQRREIFLPVSRFKPWLSHSPFTIMTQLPQLPATAVHCFYNTTVSLLLPLALQPAVGFGQSNNILPFFPICHQFSLSSLNLSSFFLFSTFVTIRFLLCGVVSPTPNPQPGGPGYPF
jgi:hypothetical protein